MSGTIINKNGSLSSCSGTDAVDIYRIRCLISALGLLEKGIKPTRGFTITYGLTLATQYTGNKYKRTEIEQAKQDLDKIMQLRLQHVEIIEG